MALGSRGRGKAALAVPLMARIKSKSALMALIFLPLPLRGELQSIGWIGWEEYLQILESIKETLAGGEVAQAGIAQWPAGQRGRDGMAEGILAELLKAHPCSFQEFCRS